MDRRLGIVLALALLAVLLFAGSALAAPPVLPNDRSQAHIDQYPECLTNVNFCADDSTHYYYCNRHKEYLSDRVPHYGGSATCTKSGRCSLCNVAYIWQLGHEYKDYVFDDNATCLGNGTETAKCVRYGVGDCTATQTRTAYDTALGHKLGEYVLLNEATCTQDRTERAECVRYGKNGCAEADIRTVSGTALGHAFEEYALHSEATCTQDRTERAECVRYGRGGCAEADIRTVSGTALGHKFEDYISDNNATCTQDGTKTAKCIRYGTGGCDATDTVSDPDTAKGHDYKKKVVPPTCTKGGYTTYTCQLCAYSETGNRKSALGHWFGEWAPNYQLGEAGPDADGTQSAHCRRAGCGYVAKNECTAFELRMDADAVTACPVCGAVSDGTELALVDAAKGTAMTGALPRGELVVRMGTLANGQTVLLAAFEYSGRLEQPTGAVKIALPAALLEGCMLELLGADSAEISVETDGDEAAIVLDFAPVEGEKPVRAMLFVPTAAEA